MISIEALEEPDSNWNKRLLESNCGTIYHTKEYASYLDFIGRKPIFLKFVDKKGEITAQMILGEYSRFKNKRKSASNILKKLPGLKQTICSWTFGPVFFNSEFISDTCHALRNFLISQKYIVSGSEHPLSEGSISMIGDPFKINEWGTFLIDLSKGKEFLWNKMDKHSARKNVERSINREVYVKEIKRSELDLYQKIREETKPVSLTALEGSWDRLFKIGWTCFLAFKDEKPIGGVMISFFNGYLNEWGIARTKIDTEKNFYSHDLLKWKIIEWGISKKFRYFDLTGVNPNPRNDKERGILRYKKKWGGNLVKYFQIKT